MRKNVCEFKEVIFQVKTCMQCRGITPGATSATAVAPKFSGTLTLGGGGRFCRNIAKVTPKISPRLHLCNAEGVCEMYMRDVGYLNLGASKDSHLFVRPLTEIISLHDRS